MPNNIDPMHLVCANCGEERPRRFDTQREDVEFELTPIEGLQAVYLCRSCKAYPNSEVMRQSIIFSAVGDQQLTGPYDHQQFMRNIQKVRKLKARQP